MDRTVVDEIELPTLRPREGAAAGAAQAPSSLLEDEPITIEVLVGSTTLTAAELPALAAGAVLTLDREVDGPVELRIGGRVVARGVLVAAGDRFGVRITEPPAA